MIIEWLAFLLGDAPSDSTFTTGPYEVWATNLRLAWMGEKARKIWGAFAHVLGDLALLWARQGNLEHMPLLVGDQDASLPLIGSERLLPQGVTESSDDYAARLTEMIGQWQMAGTPIGLLAALYNLGYTDVVLVQQNGRGFQLDGAPDYSDLANTPVTITELGGNPALDDHPWWTFDTDDEHTSRFAVLVLTPPAEEQLTLLRRLIKEWRPAKAKCVAIYTLIEGEFWDWPTGTWDEPGGFWGPSTVVEDSAE